MTDASEGALTGWRRFTYRFHLLICPFCVSHRHQVESTIQAVKALPHDKTAGDARARALAAFREKKKAL